VPAADETVLPGPCLLGRAVRLCGQAEGVLRDKVVGLASAVWDKYERYFVKVWCGKDTADTAATCTS
jgi:hypothetical protein